MKLAEWIAREGLTHREFAERLDVSQVTVSRYANGTRVPRTEHFERIFVLTSGEVAPNDFFDLSRPDLVGEVISCRV